MDKHLVYVVAIDIGSTNIKILIMEIDGETITEKYKTVIEKFSGYENASINTDYVEKIIIDILKNNNIDMDLVEAIVITGSRVLEDEKKLLNKKNIYIKEFDAIGIGGVILAHKNEGIVVNLGTGTTFIYSNIDKSVYLGGTALGSGTCVGILSRVVEKKDINYFDLVKSGESKNVDLVMSDISREGLGILKGDVTASNFGAVYKKYNDSDFAAGLMNMIIENVGLQLKYIRENVLRERKSNNIDVIFVGGFSKEEIVKKYLKKISDYTNVNYIYVDNEYAQFATVIGAYEYYLIKMREKH